MTRCSYRVSSDWTLHVERVSRIDFGKTNYLYNTVLVKGAQGICGEFEWYELYWFVLVLMAVSYVRMSIAAYSDLLHNDSVCLRLQQVATVAYCQLYK